MNQNEVPNDVINQLDTVCMINEIISPFIQISYCTVGQRDGTMLKHGPQVGCRFDTIVIKNVGLVCGLTKGEKYHHVYGYMR